MAVSSADDLLRTPLYHLHGELNARMVPFAGYSMPVQYVGVKAEHLHTREMAGLFDVSHMGQVLVRGVQAAQQLEALVPVNLVDLPVNKQTYALLTNNEGGIIDDLMICRWDEETFFLVVNAAGKEKDLALLEAQLEGLTVELLEEKALVALQGPKAVSVIATIFPESQALTFMTGYHADFDGNPVYITRAGYTGEDGFEISVAADPAEKLARILLANNSLIPIGLGARDSLRLEAGLCLYGHDLDEQTSPIEAGLRWVIAKKYRSDPPVLPKFLGADIILAQLASGPDRIRVGFKPTGKIPIKEGTDVLNSEGTKVGIITSGGYGPSVGGPIAMGYVNTQFMTNTEFIVEIRNRTHKIVKVSLPFIKHRYHKH